MKIGYKGMDKNFNYRIAEITYNEDSEDRIMNRIIQVMLIHGYEISKVMEGYAVYKVDSMDEYREFCQKYKEIKKSVKLWEKFKI